MATVLFFALVVLVDGVLSLVLDRDVIAEADAGPLVPIAMTGSVCVLVFVLTLRRSPISRVGRVVVAVLGSIVLGPLIGSLAFAVVREQAGAAVVFFGEYVLSPFVIAAGLIAAVVVLAHSFVPSAGSGTI